MDLSSYAGLQATALEFMSRDGVAADVAAAPAWVTLGEAKLNRLLGAVETDATLAGTIGSRRIDLSSLSLVKPIALYLAETGLDERKVEFKTDGTFAYLATSGRPSFAGFDGTNIDFDRPLDAAYPFRLRYRQRFALATTSPNWLLTNHPDIYLAATLMWGAGYHEDWSNGAVWKNTLDEGIPEVRSIIAQGKRGTLTVDPGLIAAGGGRSLSEWTNDA